MPTEVEWEYLARGGSLTGTQYKYSGSNNCSDVAWTSTNASGYVHAVKDKTPNSKQLYDMSGNVYEYVWDWYGGAITPSTPSTGVGYEYAVQGSDGNVGPIVRGGAYNYGDDAAEISYRLTTNRPEMRWANCGVRVVRNSQ